MTNEADKFWQKVAKDLARQSGVAPLTPEDAQKEFEALPDVKLTDSEVESIIGDLLALELFACCIVARMRVGPDADDGPPWAAN